MPHGKEISREILQTGAGSDLPALFSSRLESQGFGCNWFGFDQRHSDGDLGAILFHTV